MLSFKNFLIILEFSNKIFQKSLFLITILQRILRKQSFLRESHQLFEINLKKTMSNHLHPGFSIGTYVFERNIGAGAFASVWRAHHKLSNSIVAIKVIEKATISTQVAQTRLQREIALLKQMDHPFIAEFFQVMENHEFYFLVMEYVENGNLLDYVNSNGRLSEEQARRYFAQLISVLEYLHEEKKVAHRDLKCENVLLDKYNNIRLIDFGLSNMFTDVCPQLSTACGSPAYAAPEMIKGNTYTIAADIWSAGILLFAIVAGHLPYDDDNVQRLLQKIVYTEVFYPSFLSPPLVDLLHKMICKDPDERITLDKIKEHPWFSQAEYFTLLQQSYFDSIRNNDSGEGAECKIDREIIDRMTKIGVDTHNLHQSLLTGEFTELTSLYHILLREKVTEIMKDSMTKVQQSLPFKTPGRMQTMPLMRPPGKHVPIAGVPTGQPHVPPVPTKKPFAQRVSCGTQPPLSPSAQRVLKSPVLNNTSGRRLSRPIAVRRPMQNPQLVSHEMP
ncbi:CAMK family protein kinase [Tritrichomonas foetus]|uniref:non-specific serine/threonine protein kinase n=1 Tax=Tritrichomonas foetus TaxID=1144522 RepID=A0A1J4KCV7_9EUKA|nr:CAMK family protein kinase [Tritrichomonas foetus]|eukprot:OHT07540.1 CAMK family protein kinase [Tritrichomonas foetus]